MRLWLGLLAGSLTGAGAAAASAPTEAKVELRAGQHHITGSTYSAIVPPTGLWSWLAVGGKPFLAAPAVINTGGDFNLPAIHACPGITQPAPTVLVCTGDEATITYTFGSETIDLEIRAQAVPIKFFLNLAAPIEGLLAESRDVRWGRRGAVGGKPLAAYSLNEFQAYWAGQLLTVRGMQVLYSPPNVLRLDLAKGAIGRVQLRAIPATTENAASFAIAPVYGDVLTVLSPRNYQVFQRRTAAEGVIRVAGRLRARADRVEFRRGVEDWQPVSVDAATGSFAGQVSAPAGGWYRCEVRAVRSGAVVASQSIEHVGVGEVFVGAGQSNSTNCGETRQRPQSGLVSTFSGLDWRPADDPQPGVHDDSGMGSFWPAFGDAMAARLRVPIGVAVTGHGATHVGRWRPGSDLFDWTLERILQLGPQGFRLVLWHQGESDGATPPEEYARRLRTIIEEANGRAGWVFPWMVARVTATRGQDLLVAQNAALAGPDTDLLQGEFRGRNGTDVHFSALGLRRHGEFWAEKVGAWLEAGPAGVPEGKP
jgi:hypothetical protein